MSGQGENRRGRACPTLSSQLQLHRGEAAVKSLQRQQHEAQGSDTLGCCWGGRYSVQHPRYLTRLHVQLRPAPPSPVRPTLTGRVGLYSSPRQSFYTVLARDAEGFLIVLHLPPLRCAHPYDARLVLHLEPRARDSTFAPMEGTARQHSQDSPGLTKAARSSHLPPSSN